MESHETTKTVHNAWKMEAEKGDLIDPVSCRQFISKSTGRSGSPASVTQKTSNANGDSHSGKNSPSPAPNSPTTSVASAPYSQSWKVVGSPPNRVIHSIPPNSDDQASTGKKSDDDAQEPKLRRPSSTPGTPQRHLNGGSELTSRLLSNASPSKIQQQQPNIVHSNGDAANGKWGALPGLQWTSTSIWNGQNQQQGSGSGSKGASRASPTPAPVVANEEVNNNSSYERDIGSPPGMGKLPIPVPPNPQYRQQRSLSFSVGQHDTDLFFGYAPQSRRDSIPYRNTLHSLPLMEEEVDDLPYAGRFRGRSKSSAAAYGIISAHQEVPHAEDVNDYRRDSEYSESGSIWNTQGAHSEGPLLHHRRSMPGTSDYPGMWESFNASAPTAAYLAAMASTTEQDRYEKLRQRRFSVSQATPYGHEYRFMDGTPDLRMMSNRPTIDPAGYAHLAQRRHSVAGPAISLPQTARYHLSEALENLHISNQPVSYTNETSYPSIPEDVDDYFDNDESRTRAWNELGKGLPLHAIPTHGPLYLVEFKAGRTDLFYVTENSGVVVKKGDLVIVEADRGKDLGKITNDSITPQQVQILQQQAEAMNDGHRVNKEIHPKRIYRLAQPAEVTMLVTKNQDEAKAMLVCQTKVRQKKLPMEVVDAEYQWDRRKLTFYFIAERRIDFRELVRDLFKIYKTRIWMCAVNPLMNKAKK